MASMCPRRACAVIKGCIKFCVCVSIRTLICGLAPVDVKLKAQWNKRDAYFKIKTVFFLKMFCKKLERFLLSAISVRHCVSLTYIRHVRVVIFRYMQVARHGRYRFSSNKRPGFYFLCDILDPASQRSRPLFGDRLVFFCACYAYVLPRGRPIFQLFHLFHSGSTVALCTAYVTAGAAVIINA